jgi:hypothetical protein
MAKQSSDALAKADKLADEINACHSSVVDSTNQALGSAITAGQKLKEAKELVGFGGWMKWVEVHFTFPDRTARLYMQLAENSDKIAEWTKQNNVADLSIRGALEVIKQDFAPPEQPQADPADGSAQIGNGAADLGGGETGGGDSPGGSSSGGNPGTGGGTTTRTKRSPAQIADDIETKLNKLPIDQVDRIATHCMKLMQTAKMKAAAS